MAPLNDLQRVPSFIRGEVLQILIEMRLHIKSLIILSGLIFMALISCSDDNGPVPEPEEETKEEVEEKEEEVVDINDLENPAATVETDLGISEFFDEAKVDDNYVLVNDASSNSAYLMDKRSKKLFDFNLNDKRIGNDVQLLPDGKLLAMLEADEPTIKIGGFGGIIQLLGTDGTVEWTYEYSSEDYIAHHDAELLPNGNIIFQIWERKTAQESSENGYSLEVDVFPDGILEIDPTSDEIVWEWHAWDHIIQDHDETKSNYGVIGENPHRIDVNYITDEKGDIMHANGISYDANKDIIYLSANFFSEVWVIDHSTTTEEAASSEGGNYGKGGDLIYRFGNPKAYDNPAGTVRFDHNHYPNLLTGEDEGKMLIFSNGFEAGKSTVYELKLPSSFELLANTDNEPQVLWSFTHDSLHSPKVSGAVKLPNGNRLITEGDFGYWEVTEEGQVVWRFKGTGFFWRGYHIGKNSEIIDQLGL